jgi:hypothetical protein
MLGHDAAAVEQLRETVKLAPQDRLAAELLKKYDNTGTGAEKPPLLPPNPTPLPANPAGSTRPVDGIDS